MNQTSGPGKTRAELSGACLRETTMSTYRVRAGIENSPEPNGTSKASCSAVRSAQLQVWNQPPLSNSRPRSFDQSTSRTVLLMFPGTPASMMTRSARKLTIRVGEGELPRTHFSTTKVTSRHPVTTTLTGAARGGGRKPISACFLGSFCCLGIRCGRRALRSRSPAEKPRIGKRASNRTNLAHDF